MRSIQLIRRYYTSCTWKRVLSYRPMFVSLLLPIPRLLRLLLAIFIDTSAKARSEKGAAGLAPASATSAAQAKRAWTTRKCPAY